jgi:hypothetical protein
MTSFTTRICIQCRWFTASPQTDARGGNFDRCTNPRRGREPVRGSYRMRYCEQARQDPSDCGFEGTWFEPQEQEQEGAP